MHLSAADRTIALAVREFAEFTTGPSRSGAMRFDPQRARLGQVWHDELRRQTTTDRPDATFEVSLDCTLAIGGWSIRLTGRIDQVLPAPAPSSAGSTGEKPSGAIVREVKTVMRPLPVAEDDLRSEYRSYFLQLAAYQCLHVPTNGGRDGALAGELVFVEPATGFVQVVPQSGAVAEELFHARLGELRAFADGRLAGLERLRNLSFRPAFATPRPGQETVLDDLRAAAARSPVVLFEAPTGFGKTGCALEYALEELRTGRLTRLIYLTGKSTGQLQVVRQLAQMVGHPPGATWWQIRNKGEHCVNEVYHCFRDACRFLDGQEERWPDSGLQRFAHDAGLPRDLETLRAAGREACICPYEITRATLPFTDVWIADYNYLFSPHNRTFLGEMPGFEPEHTLLVIDEAHNLPARVADAYSSELDHAAARRVLGALDVVGAPAAFLSAWESLVLFLARIEPADTLDPLLEAELLDHLAAIHRLLEGAVLDFTALGPAASETLFLAASLHDSSERGSRALPELVWSPARGVIAFTCLDASEAIADTLREYGHVVFLSATLSPVEVFDRQCGLGRIGVEPAFLAARTPWRDTAYTVAVDARVDTRYDKRSRWFATTAATIVALHAAGDGPVVAFFSSYAYAEKILGELDALHPAVRPVLQPRTRDLAAQTAFLENALAFSDVILLVLGSSFAESIDLLGGRVIGAVVVGPALPEVNAVQRARLTALRGRTRDEAFREVYQIPGMVKVNQALGRLVRAPGHRARVILHCRRFAELSYQRLLAPEYQMGETLADDADLAGWLAR
jgi:Rad3-related DNA helicase